MKYLFLSTHVDDVHLAAGGTIDKLIKSGHDVHNCSMSCVYDKGDLTDEFIRANEKIGMVNKFSILHHQTRHFHEQYDDILQHLFLLKNENYDCIFAPSSQDYHSDHSTVGRCAERVFKNSNLITYTSDWNTRNRRANYYISLSQSNIEQKIAALSCYESQKEKLYMHPDYTWANALNNGVACGVKYAEAFHVVNIIQ